MPQRKGDLLAWQKTAGHNRHRLLMNVVRTAWIEAKALHRVLGFWLLGFLLAWLLLIRLQEPEFFRRQGVPFYWASVRALLVCVLALLPLIWCLGQGPATVWTLRCTSTHTGKILSSWLSIVGYAVYIVALTTLSAFALDSIYSLSTAWTTPLGVAAACLPALLVLAALAPALVLMPLGRTQTIFVWLLLMALVLHFLWPGPAVVDEPLVGLLSVLQATAAGLLLSLAVTLHRVRSG